MKSETTGRLELNHLEEFRDDVKSLYDKWLNRLDSYNYGWHTMATISNELLPIEKVLKNLIKEIECTEICDGT